MEDYQDYVIRKIETCKDHYFVISENQDKNSDLISVNCRNCPTGASISKDFELKDGKICPLS